MAPSVSNLPASLLTPTRTRCSYRLLLTIRPQHCMRLSERIETFAALGDYLRSPAHEAELTEIAELANRRNNWFIPANSRKALRAIADEFLSIDKLTAWTAAYPSATNSDIAAVPATSAKRVGVVMAGNIPAVGFHDLLSVLISGHHLLAKLSTQDFVLMQYLIQKIKDINPTFAEYITVAERLNDADAFITTGSDNTARYFDYYFGKRPHIIRKNRTSVGLLMGAEMDGDLDRLGDDILSYFGLGCRNVSTLLVPDDEDGTRYVFDRLLRTLEPRAPDFLNHHKYLNNYDYNKSIYLVNRVPHLDNGFLLVTQNETGLVSPISVVYFQTYATQDDAAAILTRNADKIQVVASADRGDGQGWFTSTTSPVVAFGQTQRPSLTDYADGVDTMAFLASL